MSYFRQIREEKEVLQKERRLTKRALDAGDSAASQAFSPLLSFFYTQSGFCQCPSATTDDLQCQGMEGSLLWVSGTPPGGFFSCGIF